MREINKHNVKTTPVIDKNLAILHQRINELRDIWGKPMIVTSGLRSEEFQQKLIEQKKTNAKHSLHLVGAAVDILDVDGSLGEWCLKNLNILASIGLWIESPTVTQGWVHFQIFPPRSMNRVFLP